MQKHVLIFEGRPGQNRAEVLGLLVDPDGAVHRRCPRGLSVAIHSVTQLLIV